MNDNNLDRREFVAKISAGTVVAMLAGVINGGGFARAAVNRKDTKEMPAAGNWQAGIAKRVITPETGVWLAGFGKKRVPEGKIHDIWVKVLALKNSDGKRLIIATTDHMGMSKTIYERLFAEVQRRFKLDRSEFMLTFSHNHCGPCIEDDLVDYYPSDEEQRRLVKDYTQWMEGRILAAIEEAVNTWRPVNLFAEQGKCTFAVNRRDNKEADIPKMIAEGQPFKGVSDHYVPVLAIKTAEGSLVGILFGYACHPTTLSINFWCGDYPGYAQINLERKYPGITAMFFNACGADQNPLPRGKVELCEQYGKMLSDAVVDVLDKPMSSLSNALETSFRFVDIPYEEIVTREKLLPIAKGDQPLQARWAKRMLDMMDKGVNFPRSYPYPVQASRIGELLLIGIGGEAVVDYSLRFKKEFPGRTWVCGYTNDMAGYMPSRRVWEEGGYEGGPHLDEFGRPAWRWKGNVEEKISRTVHKVSKKVNRKFGRSK